MRIALIADIHANLPALESVFDHIKKNGVDTVWNLGDAVGYGAYPDEVICFLQNEFILNILGNYDRKVLRIKKSIKKWKNRKLPLKILAFKWTFDQLSPGSRDYLASLPEKIEINISGWNIHLTHGSPASREEHLTLETPDCHLSRLSEMLKADIILCGHSHQPFARRIRDVWFINPGSVGRPDDGADRVGEVGVDGEDALRHQETATRCRDDERGHVAGIPERGGEEGMGRHLRGIADLDEVPDAGGSGGSPRRCRAD
ncbi:MAG: metallophosphatase family protein, partial [Anaerolineaceae bacterium]|nr:metallophosphatase family protein [Anaerolineaceae bacterium]